MKRLIIALVLLAAALPCYGQAPTPPAPPCCGQAPAPQPYVEHVEVTHWWWLPFCGVHKRKYDKTIITTPK